MTESGIQPGTKVPDKGAALRGSEATLNEQLARDTAGSLRDEVLDELAVAVEAIHSALEEGNVTEEQERILVDLLAAIRLGETVVTETWNSVHA